MLDFSRPIALSLIALMHFIPDEQDAHSIVRNLVDTLPSGSYLVLSHASSDVFPELSAQVTAEYAKGGIQLGFRTRAEVERFFEGLDLVSPGLVTATKWAKSGGARSGGQRHLRGGGTRPLSGTGTADVPRPTHAPRPTPHAPGDGDPRDAARHRVHAGGVWGGGEPLMA